MSEGTPFEAVNPQSDAITGFTLLASLLETLRINVHNSHDQVQYSMVVLYILNIVIQTCTA